MKGVLITGCNGYIGVDMSIAFNRHGWEVWGVDIVPPNANQRGLFKDFVCSRVQDLTMSKIPKVDAVVHLAGASKVVDTHSEVYYYDNNVGTTKVLRGLYPDTAIYLASTTGMYNEKGEVEHKHYYTSSKELAEEYADIAFRMGTLCGANANGHYHLVMDLMIHNAITKGEITVAQGNKWRPLLSLTHACEAWVQYVTSGHLMENIANGYENVFMNLYETVATIEDIARAIVDVYWVRRTFDLKPEDVSSVKPVELKYQDDLEGIEKKAPPLSSVPSDFNDSSVWRTRLLRLVAESIERYQSFVRDGVEKG